MKIATHWHSFGGRALQLRQVSAQEHDPVTVVNNAIRGRFIGRAAPVFR